DAAIVLVDDVLPLLRVLAPDVRVRLAGTGMPADIEQRLNLTPNVQVVGPVGDAAGFVAGCRVMALPIRRRGGVPFKLIEAMAAQRPRRAPSRSSRGQRRQGEVRREVPVGRLERSAANRDRGSRVMHGDGGGEGIDLVIVST